MTTSETLDTSDYSAMNFMRNAGFLFLAVALVNLVLKIITEVLGLFVLSIISSVLLSLAIVLLGLSARRIALKSPSIKRYANIAGIFLISYILLSIASVVLISYPAQDIELLFILIISGLAVGFLATIPRIIGFHQLNDVFKRLSRHGYRMDAGIFPLYGWYGVLSVAALIIAAFTFIPGLILVINIALIIGEIVLLFAIGIKLIRNSIRLPLATEELPAPTPVYTPDQTKDQEQVVVEAVNLEKLFPVMGGFFQSLFSVENMKISWNITKKYFSGLFSKGGFKKFSPLTREYFNTVFSSGKRYFVHAVDDLSFKIHRGETFGLVGESGCGKSTTGLLLLNLLDSTGGQIYFKTPDSIILTRKQIRDLRIKEEKEILKLTRRQRILLRGDEDIETLVLTEEQISSVLAEDDLKHHDTSSIWQQRLTWITSFGNLLLLKPNRITLTEEQLLSLGTVRRLDITSFSVRELKNLRKDIQIIFQNPYESLSPRFSILDIIAEPIRLLNIMHDEAEIENMVKQDLEEVGLIPAEDFIDRFPHELSGGQRQRVGVARSFIVNPTFVVADEPVSMLDVSIRVGVLKIMRELTKQRGTAFLFITHDLALARVMCDRIAVMYLGRIVEQGPTEDVIHDSYHPYTRALIAAVPKPDPDARRTEELPIIGEVPSGIDIGTGCRFSPRCPYAIEKCEEIDPQLEEAHEGHLVACIRFRELDKLE